MFSLYRKQIADIRMSFNKVVSENKELRDRLEDKKPQVNKYHFAICVSMWKCNIVSVIKTFAKHVNHDKWIEHIDFQVGGHTQGHKQIYIKT